MSPLHPDLLLVLFGASAIFSIAGVGILALPWTDQEVARSSAAWGAAATLPLVGAAAVARRALAWLPAQAPGAELALLDEGELLPAALPFRRRDRSRARLLGHVRQSARCVPA